MSKAGGQAGNSGQRQQQAATGGAQATTSQEKLVVAMITQLGKLAGVPAVLRVFPNDNYKGDDTLDLVRIGSSVTMDFILKSEQARTRIRPVWKDIQREAMAAYVVARNSGDMTKQNVTAVGVCELLVMMDEIEENI